MILMPVQACRKPVARDARAHGLKHTWLYHFKPRLPVDRIMASETFDVRKQWPGTCN